MFLLSINKKVLTPSEISKLGYWHISTVTRLLKPLKAKGFIRVETDINRPRYKTVTLTSEGKLILAHLVDVIKNMEQFPFDMNHLTMNEVSNFLMYGQKILDLHKGKDGRYRVYLNLLFINGVNFIK